MFAKYKTEIYFILFILQITLVYKMIQWYFPDGQIFKTPLDDQIPFVAWFIFPYLLYALILAVIFTLALRNKKFFGALTRAFLFASLISNIIFIVFPTMMVRAEVLPDSFVNQSVYFIYSIDSALRNCFPSEHVTFSVLANLCLMAINKKWALLLLPFTILVVLATLFIKQHYIPDVLAGIVLAYISYQFVFKKCYQTPVVVIPTEA